MQNNFIHKLHSKNAGMLCKQKQCNDCYILETHILLMLEHRNIVEQFLNINLLRTGEYLMNRLNKIVWKLRKSGEISVRKAENHWKCQAEGHLKWTEANWKNVPRLDE